MGIDRTTIENVPDYKTLYPIKIDSFTHINEYGGEYESDYDCLEYVTNAAPGSTCLFSNGTIYRLELSGWKKFGEETESESNTVANPNISPLSIDRVMFTKNADSTDDELTAEVDKILEESEYEEMR